MTRMPPANDAGIDRNVMSDARQFIRNRNSTTMTINAPSTSAVFRFRIAVSMKLAWRNTWVFSVTPAGSVFLMSASIASAFAVVTTVSAP